jgi:hypothetical protein
LIIVSVWLIGAVRTALLLLIATLIAVFALAAIKTAASRVFADHAAGKKHERESDENVFGCGHLDISDCAAAGDHCGSIGRIGVAGIGSEST